jgi:hypothetical protein
MIKMCCFVIFTDLNFEIIILMCLKILVSIEIHYPNYNDEPRDFPSIYLIRIFSAISLNDNWH